MNTERKKEQTEMNEIETTKTNKHKCKQKNKTHTFSMV